MTELRYNRAFKKALGDILFCIILFCSIIVFFIISKIQYDRLVSDMKPLEATIVDIDLDVHIKGPDELICSKYIFSNFKDTSVLYFQSD